MLKQHWKEIGLFLLVIFLVIIYSWKGLTPKNFGNSSPQPTQTQQRKTLPQEKDIVKINSLQVRVDYAKDDASRTKGLSGRDSLEYDRGMFFVFDKEQKYTFWMKDVKFPIDIIWISKDKKVVDYYKNAEVQLGVPDNQLKIYAPQSSALYVLEVNAGIVDKYDIKIGDQAEF